MKIYFQKDDLEIQEKFNIFFKNHYLHDTYQQHLDEISKLNSNNFYFWISAIASRNHYQTDSYLNFLKIIFLSEIKNEFHKDLHIKVDSYLLKMFLLKTFQKKIKVSLEGGYLKKLLIEDIKNLLFTLKEISAFLLFKLFIKNVNYDLNNKLLISSYLLNDIKELDRVIPSKFLSDSKKEVVFFVNFVSRNPFKIFFLSRDLERKNINYLSRYSLLTFKDFVTEIRNIFFPKIIYPSFRKSSNIDFFYFFRLSNNQKSFYRNSLAGALNKAAAEKIGSENSHIIFLNIGENQTLDKGLNYGFNKSNSKCFSFFLQNYLPRRLDFFMFPNKQELIAKVVPPTIFSPFSFISEKIENAFSFKKIPAFKYSNLWEVDDSKNKKENFVSIFLPNSPNESSTIIKEVLEVIKEFKNLSWKIKLHPMGVENEKLLKYLKSYEFIEVSYANSNELIKKSKIVITGNSGVMVDCIYQKKQCFIFSEINLIPIEFLENHKNFYAWSKSKELRALINNYLESDKKIDQTYKSDEFNLVEPNRKNMSFFLNELIKINEPSN